VRTKVDKSTFDEWECRRLSRGEDLVGTMLAGLGSCFGQVARAPTIPYPTLPSLSAALSLCLSLVSRSVLLSRYQSLLLLRYSRYRSLKVLEP